eukprot:gene24186-29366_t
MAKRPSTDYPPFEEAEAKRQAVLQAPTGDSQPLTSFLSTIQEAIFDGHDNLEAILKDFLTEQQRQGLYDITCEKTIQALAYGLEVTTTKAVLTEFLMVLAALTQNSEGVQFALASACEHTTLKVLQSHATHGDLQAAGLSVLVNLISDDEKGVDALLAAGAVKVVLRTLQQLPHLENVQALGLRLVRNLTEIDEVCSEVVADGGVSIALRGMKQFPDSKELQECACTLCANLAIGDELGSAQSLLLTGGALDLVTVALQTFTDHLGIQDQGLNMGTTPVLGAL